MGYLPYYLIWVIAGIALEHPEIMLGAVAIFLLRRWLPDPYLFLKHWAKVRRLGSEIQQNPDNVTARRDLARIWLEKRRPRRALPLLEAALTREPDHAELQLLQGKALLLSGRAEDALGPLVKATQINEKIYYGDAYLLAGRALSSLDRYPEAEDALMRYLAINSSSVEGRVRLASARRQIKESAGADHALKEALETFSQLPGFRRRAELLWFLRAQLMRVGLA